MTIEIEESGGCVFQDLGIQKPKFLDNVTIHIKSRDKPRVVKKKMKNQLKKMGYKYIRITDNFEIVTEEDKDLVS